MTALLIWAQKNYTRLVTSDLQALDDITDMSCQWNKHRSTAHAVSNEYPQSTCDRQM